LRLNVENFAEALDAFRGMDAQAGFPNDGNFAVGVGLVGIAHDFLRMTPKVYQGFSEIKG
jgi:hypothetical protein